MTTDRSLREAVEVNIYVRIIKIMNNYHKNISKDIVKKGIEVYNYVKNIKIINKNYF